MKLNISSTSETCSYQTLRFVLPSKLVYFIILRRIFNWTDYTTASKPLWARQLGVYRNGRLRSRILQVTTPVFIGRGEENYLK